jgi:hypothetical protein
MRGSVSGLSVHRTAELVWFGWACPLRLPVGAATGHTPIRLRWRDNLIVRQFLKPSAIHPCDTIVPTSFLCDGGGVDGVGIGEPVHCQKPYLSVPEDDERLHVLRSTSGSRSRQS